MLLHAVSASKSYHRPNVVLLQQIFKQLNDDRLWVFVPEILANISKYMVEAPAELNETLCNDTKLLSLVCLML